MEIRPVLRVVAGVGADECAEKRARVGAAGRKLICSRRLHRRYGKSQIRFCGEVKVFFDFHSNEIVAEVLNQFVEFSREIC